MRISDWSSDVCSSDLAEAQAREALEHAAHHHRLKVEFRSHVRDQHEIGADRFLAAGADRDFGFLAGTVLEDVRIAPPALGEHFVPLRRSEEPPSELQSLMRISYAVFCLKKNNLIS